MALIIKDLAPGDLNEILSSYPDLKKYAKPEPQNAAYAEDREAGLISLLIPCIPPLLLLIKELIAYKREKAGNRFSLKGKISIEIDKDDDSEILKKLADVLKKQK